MVEQVNTSRRWFLRGGLALMAAPAIVKVGSLMPLSVPKPSDLVLRWIGDPETWRVETWRVEPQRLIVSPDLEEPAGHLIGKGMDSARFRELLEPGLREHFAKYYNPLTFDAVFERRSKALTNVLDTLMGRPRRADLVQHWSGTAPPVKPFKIEES